MGQFKDDIRRTLKDNNENALCRSEMEQHAPIKSESQTAGGCWRLLAAAAENLEVLNKRVFQGFGSFGRGTKCVYICHKQL
jgi:hypothetical protein